MIAIASAEQSDVAQGHTSPSQVGLHPGLMEVQHLGPTQDKSEEQDQLRSALWCGLRLPGALPFPLLQLFPPFHRFWF